VESFRKALDDKDLEHGVRLRVQRGSVHRFVLLQMPHDPS